MKYKYDSESDVLSITVSPTPFDYAKENGDFIVHFDKNNKPIYIEILNAYSFLRNAAISLPELKRQEIISP